MNNHAKTVNCPTCQKAVKWLPENQYRPFCSKRCQLIDFGEWATEKNSIAGEPVFPPEESEQESLQ